MRALAVTLGTTAVCAALLVSQRASADSLIIKNPSDHPDFRAELEPHGTLVPWGDSFGYGRYYNGGYAFGFGAGFRATIKIVDPVIPRLNNTIGITFGLDVTSCDYCDAYYRDQRFSLWTPVGAQWTFFLTHKWSVFADIGFVPHSNGFYRGSRYQDAIFFEPMFEVGGRYHFRDKITLTMRLGYPFITVGVSFFI